MRPRSCKVCYSILLLCYLEVRTFLYQHCTKNGGQGTLPYGLRCFVLSVCRVAQVLFWITCVISSGAHTASSAESLYIERETVGPMSSEMLLLGNVWPITGRGQYLCEITQLLCLQDLVLFMCCSGIRCKVTALGSSGIHGLKNSLRHAFTGSIFDVRLLSTIRLLEAVQLYRLYMLTGVWFAQPLRVLKCFTFQEIFSNSSCSIFL